MLDLPDPGAAAPPRHWLAAPLPDAPLYEAQPAALARTHHHLPATPALLAALNARAAGLLVAWDSSGAPWRLRHAGRGLWQVQSIADSRARLQQRLRGLLGGQLIECVLHELRNPLNALSLHTDLVARLLGDGEPDAAPRSLNSVAVIKERLLELRRRQDAALTLWLGPPDGAAPFAAVAAHGLRLLRGHAALQQVRLRDSGLDALDQAQLPRGAAPAQLAVLALLVMACAGARRDPAAAGEAEVLVAAQREAGAVVLEIQAQLDGAALARELADGNEEELLAALALLLEPAGLRLEARPQEALTRLILSS